MIDRILAVVGRDLITLSDRGCGGALGLVPPPPPGRDVVRTTLDALIARQLELAEANRYQPPEPPAASVEARLDEVRAPCRRPARRCGGAGAAGLSEEQLRLRLRDDLRIEAFLAQRFGAARQPSEPGASQAYYQAHAGGLHECLAAACARSRMFASRSGRSWTATQRVATGQRWLDGLRRATEIADLYVAEQK